MGRRSVGGDRHRAGVPLINCISNPLYLLTGQDALRWVDRGRLPRVAAAFDQIVRRLDARPRETIAAVGRLRFRRLLMRALMAATRAWSARLETRRFS